QLLREGVARRFETVAGAQKVALLAAIGQLQFEVLVHRLKSEYGAEARLESAPWTLARWWRIPGKPDPTPATAGRAELPDAPQGSRLAFDDRGRPIALFVDRWPLRF